MISPGSQQVRIAGRYAVRRKLGSGTTGSVFLVRDEATQKLVALKLLHAERLAPPDVAAMQAEFRAIAALDHPHVARAHDFGYTSDGTPYYTRDYVSGEPLPAGPPAGASAAVFLRPILDLLEALQYIHEHGTLHLDIHAGNLIVSDRAERPAVLIDLGLGPTLGRERFSTSSTADGSLPPELVEHGHPTERTDLYFVGRLLLHRLTGRTVGDARLPDEIPGWGTRLTLDLERILARSLQTSTAMRFDSAREFRDALRAALGGGDAPTAPLSGSRDVFVGRDDELHAVEEALRQVAGLPVLHGFVGREGLGKTRLLREVRLSAQLRGFVTVDVRFDPDDEGGSPLLRALAATEVGERSWLDALDPCHGGTPSQRAQRCAEAYFSEPGVPFVLVLDDLEHADTASRSVLVALAAESARQARLGDCPRGLGVFSSSGDRTAIPFPDEFVSTLEPLDEAAAVELLDVLVAPRELEEHAAERLLAAARGSPGLLRRAARWLEEVSHVAGGIPERVEVPELTPRRSLGGADWDRLTALEQSVVQTLAVFGRSATRRELATALEVDAASVDPSLRRLVDGEILAQRGPADAKRYRLHLDRDGVKVAGIGQAEAVEVHRRMIRSFERQDRAGPLDAHELEDFSRHLLAVGDDSRARSVAMRAVESLIVGERFDRALSLLERLAAAVRGDGERFAVARAASRVCEETGDHRAGIRTLEPVVEDLRCRGPVGSPELVDLGRRLGIHHHRAGDVDRARSVFDETVRHADPWRDVEHLVFIDTELAELHLFQGDYDAAEVACQRGLERLSSAALDDAFSGRMRLMLRASLGHVALRRMDLETARRELLESLGTDSRVGTTVERAAVLNNLAIVENQLSLFSSARRRFCEAERLLLRCGERRDILKVATNLAVIDAKLGDVDSAWRQIERAEQLLRRFPDRRLEFFTAYARGVVELLVGLPHRSAETFERALPIGRELGDVHLVGFGLVQSGEGELLCGRYAKARRLLEAARRDAVAQGSVLLERMASARLFAVHALLGESRRARQIGRALEERADPAVPLLEAWNRVFVAVGQLLCGDSPVSSLEWALAVFQDSGVEFGIRTTRLGLLVVAIASASDKAPDSRELDTLRARLAGDATGTQHVFLDVAEAIARAEAYFLLGQDAVAQVWLDRASGSIVGCPFLELDVRIELLRARLARRLGDVRDARRHLHRSAHSRDLLVQLAPQRSRKRLRERLGSVDALGEQLARTPEIVRSTARLWETASYAGLVGRSAPMLRVVESIESIRDAEIPVAIVGETGTGKDLVARAIADRGLRSGRPFMALHCGSLPEELFEVELFGYEAGAFTGAEESRPGILEELDGGTLYLDDAEELSLAAQAKLVRVFDSGRARRVGATRDRRVDVRLLLSMRRDPDAAVADGILRADFRYRLAGVDIRLPPLRERSEDIPALVRHLIAKHADRLGRDAPRVTASAIERLAERPWPGNVRELEMVLLRALVRAPALESLAFEQLGLEEAVPVAHAAGFARGLGSELLERSLDAWRDDLERAYLRALFAECGGDLTKMHERLDVGRTKLYAWFRRLGLDVRALREEL